MIFVDLDYSYCSIPYLSEVPYCAYGRTGAEGVQFTSVINAQEPTGVQLNIIAADGETARGVQLNSTIDSGLAALGFSLRSYNLYHIIAPYYCVEGTPYCGSVYCSDRVNVIAPIQFNGIAQGLHEVGVQFNGVITDSTLYGLQTQHVINASDPVGVQLTGFVAHRLGLQFTSVLYNTCNLRILYRFPSRGTSGTNWTASSTKAGDFSVNNLNTDLVEQCWRSNDELSCWVTCDTELPQGVFLDTLAILSHNISRSAVVTLLGSNSPSMAPVGVEIDLPVTDENIFYIAPTLPMTGYRYWRVNVEDINNENDFIQIGTIVFGNSTIFQNENIVDEIRTGRRHYSDKVSTEGFTNVMNDRSMKKWTTINIRSLDVMAGNYDNLQEVFNYARTNLKCLWVPTPKRPQIYTVFAKLSELPEETHNSKSSTITYADMELNLDEAN